MDSPRNTEASSETSDDLSALAWVHDELRRSLESAHKALRRFVKEAEALSGSDVDAVDPSVLRAARQQIHQGVGALELVGLPAAATVLRACEAAVQRYVAKPHKLNTLVVDEVERASFALLDYLSRILAGKTVSPLAMFPQYRAVQEAAGAERVHPADLWSVDWRWHDLPDAGAHVEPRQPDPATRLALEQQMLAMMRQPSAPAAARMSDICAGLGAGATHPQTATLWRLAAAMFEAQALGLLHPDVFGKRVVSRLLSQLRSIERGDNQVSERLAQDLLFFCAQAKSPGDTKAPRLASVHAAYGLADETPVDYTSSALGRFDPAWITQARKRVAAAKESWSAVAGGEMHRSSGLAEQFSLVGDSLKRLFPAGETLAAELHQAMALTQHAGVPPSPPLAMEVATSLLYVEASLEDAEFDHPDQQERVRRLAQRIGAVRQGATPQPLEGWMEDLYRRVSDRQTMGSVVQELRASLSESEKLIDQFFRNPADPKVLIPVPNQLAAMRGVLSVLGMDHASSALVRMRDEVDGLISTEIDPQRISQAGVFDRLAGNLGALGFLIDMLSVQPQMAKSLFSFDPEQGTLSPVMGRSARETTLGPVSAAPLQVEPQLIEHAQMLAFSAVREDVSLEEVTRDLERLSFEAEAADQPALMATVSQAQAALELAADADDIASVRGQLSEALVDFVSSAFDGAEEPDAAVEAPAESIAQITLSTPGVRVDLSDDDEMREVFLEEAREVVETARNACAALVETPDDLSEMTSVRRAFHTLKGSSRMVGLREFGDAAWVCEQLYNTRLGEQMAADARLLEFTNWSLDYLGAWVEEIASGRDTGRQAAAVEAAASALAAPVQPAAEASAEPVAEASTEPVAEANAEPVAEHKFEPEVLRLADFPVLDEFKDVPKFDFPVEPLGLDLPSSPTVSLDLAFDATTPVPVPAAQVDTELSFDLDLSQFDSITDLSEPSPPPADVVDLGVPAISELFDAPDLAVEPLDAQADIPIEPLPVPDAVDELDLDLDLGGEALPRGSLIDDLPPTPELLAPTAQAEEPTSGPATQPAVFGEDEQVKVVGPLRISIPLFNIFLNEADELSRRLTTEVAEWAMELHRPIGETPIALAHSLAGSSATVGFTDLSHLARTLEHAQMRAHAIGHGTPDEARLFVDAAEEIRRLLHQFAAGFLKEPSPELLARLAEHEVSSGRRLEEATAAAEIIGEDVDIDIEVEADRPTLAEPLQVADETPVSDTASAPLAAPPAAAVEVGGNEFKPVFDPLGLAEFKPFTPLAADAARAPVVPHAGVDIDDDIDAIDAVDADLFPIFEEEAEDLLPKLANHLRDWARRPNDNGPGSGCMRTLHTLKGGARLAGAMRLGEMAHRLEGRIEALLAQVEPSASDIDMLQVHSDALSQTFEALRTRDAQAYAEAVAHAEQAAYAAALPDIAVAVEAPSLPEPIAEAVVPPPAEAQQPAAATQPAPQLTPLALPEIDWSRFNGQAAAPRQAADRAAASQSAVRVRAPLLDRLVNQAGEVSITRSRIEVEVGQIKSSLGDLTDNLDRLRLQLRDIELQAETQMSSRLEAAKAAAQSFDPLEFDRFTRFQELTRMMAESVNDVATVQRTLQRTLETTEDELVAQARLTRDLQDDLLRTRMVEFESMSDRLYRVVRQAAKETGKHVRLDIVGGSIDVDRGVLDRMTGAFEHLLRNCVTHGIELPEARSAAGKDPTGSIVVALSHEGNEVGVEFRDDGAGLNLSGIRDKGVAMGLLDPNQQHGDAELANLIFSPGFSTADKVTELAGRGIGMDVVRSEVNAMGGRIETATALGQGTSFKLVLPLTTAVTQVVMLRVGDATVAVPSTLVEIVRRATTAEIDEAYRSGSFASGERSMPFFWLGSLLQLSPHSTEATRSRQVVVIRSAQQRIALHVDEVLGNQEVVVKNLGPQLSRMPGLAGMTLLASGSVALIYNPVALATLYGAQARAATLAGLQAPQSPQVRTAEAAKQNAPLVLVVDDSLTVRRVTQRLLVREGYRVTLAKDGLDALERLAEEKPQMVLSDIEMPRMDGFDLVRNIRGDARLRDLPVIMITSRIAQKHRDYAAELGVDHYLGKPYSEEDLLALIGRYTSAAALAA